MSTKSEVEFHQTFQPQAEYISAVLQLAADGYTGTKEEISERTGIPTGRQKGKVVPHLKYAQFMNLISYEMEKDKFSLKLTALGEQVYQEDPYLIEDLTLAVCNYFLTCKEIGAPQWDFVFHSVPYVLDEPIDVEFIKSKCNSHFGFNVDLGVVKNSYLTGMFEQLELLEWGKTATYKRGIYSEEFLHLYAYTLLYSWETLYPDKKEIPLPDIVGEMGWGASFGFSIEDVSLLLESLADAQYVHVNRQLYPVTVVRVATREDALEKLYSNLI